MCVVKMQYKQSTLGVLTRTFFTRKYLYARFSYEMVCFVENRNIWFWKQQQQKNFEKKQKKYLDLAEELF